MRSKSILIVDDSEIIAQRLQIMLKGSDNQRSKGNVDIPGIVDFSGNSDSIRIDGHINYADSTGNGIAIRHAGDYPGALRILAESRPDIALLDIHLPGKSGIDLLQYIKVNYPTIIVIMLSNQSGDYYRRICKNLGAAYFIDKSREFELVPDIISSIQ
jgi:CheY-like chemotaxis protein